MLKYAIGRAAIFVAVAVPAILLLPADMNVFLKLMIAVVVSAGVSYVALRRWREEVAQRLSERASRRIADRERLRTALAGEPTDESDGREA